MIIIVARKRYSRLNDDNFLIHVSTFVDSLGGHSASQKTDKKRKGGKIPPHM